LIFLHLLKTPLPQLRDDTPPHPNSVYFFCFLISINVNLCMFTHPRPTFCLYSPPPNFKFLKITLVGNVGLGYNYHYNLIFYGLSLRKLGILYETDPLHEGKTSPFYGLAADRQEYCFNYYYYYYYYYFIFFKVYF